MGKVVTDPKLIAELERLSGGNVPAKSNKIVTDPALIAKLENAPVDFSTGEMVSNIPSSAAENAKNIYTAFSSPVETLKGVGNLALGAIDKGAEALVDSLPDDFVASVNKFNNMLVDKGLPLERLPENKKDMTFQNKQYADQMLKMYSDRYGSLNAFKTTLMKDPVGVLADASMALTGAGGIAKGASNVGSRVTSKIPLLNDVKVPGAHKAGQAVQQAGMAIDPLNLIATTGKYGVSKLTPNTLPQSMYKSAAKFSTTLPTAERNAITNTALKYNIMPNESGLGKLTMMIDDVGKNIDNIIDTADQSGMKIPSSVVFKDLNALRRSEGGFKLYGPKNLEKINAVAKTFNEYLKQLGKDTITPSELQAFKRSVYDEINWKTGVNKSSLIKNKIEKAIARAAKERLEQINPNLKAANATQGELLSLKAPLMQKLNRIQNNNPIPLSAGMNAAAGGIAAGPVGSALGLIPSAINSAAFQAGGAIGLNNWKNAGGLGLLMDNSLPLTIGSQSALQLGRANREGLLNF